VKQEYLVATKHKCDCGQVLFLVEIDRGVGSVSSEIVLNLWFKFQIFL
jgi:hypothetical protein